MRGLYDAHNSKQAPTLQSCLETIIYFKQNIFNFGETISLKNRADRQAASRYSQ